MKFLVIGSSGYVGSYLVTSLRDLGLDVTGVDRSPRLVGSNEVNADHESLPAEFFEAFDVVLFFAGSSSVRQALESPRLAVVENVFNLFALHQKLRADAHLIYASSASIYSGVRQGEASRESDPILGRLNPYDASKLAGELTLVGQGGCANTALRMGTVSGLSPFTRWDLVFNAMVRSAVNEGVVRVSNPHARRSILMLEDLLRAVLALSKGTENAPPVLNLASHHLEIGELAERVATTLGSTLHVEPGTPTYDFMVDTSLARTYFEPGSASLVDQIRELSTQIRDGGQS